MKKFNKRSFLDWRSRYTWEPLDRAIYELYRLPNDFNTLNSKLLVVSRCYNTNIEKRGHNIIDKLAGSFLSTGSFGAIVRSLRSDLKTASLIKCYNNPSMYLIHGKLMQMVKKVTGSRESVFASKFLHFYAPNIFPIMDSITEENLYGHEGIKDNGNIENDYIAHVKRMKLKDGTYDDRYCRFCFYLCRFVGYIHNKYHISYEAISLKALDIYLYLI